MPGLKRAAILCGLVAAAALAAGPASAYRIYKDESNGKWYVECKDGYSHQSDPAGLNGTAVCRDHDGIAQAEPGPDTAAQAPTLPDVRAVSPDTGKGWDGTVRGRTADRRPATPVPPPSPRSTDRQDPPPDDGSPGPTFPPGEPDARATAPGNPIPGLIVRGGKPH